MVDTNSDPSNIDFPIPANDDATKSITLITDIIIKAIQEGLEERKREKDEETDKEGAAEKAKVDAAPATEVASATPGKRARKTTAKAETETEKTEE